MIQATIPPDDEECNLPAADTGNNACHWRYVTETTSNCSISYPVLHACLRNGVTGIRCQSFPKAKSILVKKLYMDLCGVVGSDTQSLHIGIAFLR